MSKFRYQSIFMYASLQFCGNIEEYFSKNTKKLVVFLVMPRLKSKFNRIRMYSEGKLIEDRKVQSSDNILLYYLLWFYYHWSILIRYFSSNEKFYLIAGHPVSFFGLGLQRALRNVSHVYWMGDYFPGNNIAIRAFESLKKYYHGKFLYTAYLSDGINRVLNNGKILNTKNRKTIMWGIKQQIFNKKKLTKKFEILFVGLVKESQGLEFMFNFLKSNRDYFLSIVGICDNKLYRKFKKIIKKNKIEDQIYFPNRFFSDEELLRLSKKCHVGIALYNTDKSNPTYYTDPGKVKAYLEYMLPVIISDTSGIVPFIKRFKAGVIIERNEISLSNALKVIREDYPKYLKGVEKAIQFFDFENYYKEKFAFIK